MIKTIIRRPVTVTMAYLTVAALGLAAWKNIPLEQLPDADLPKLTVRLSWPGSSPEVVEALATAPVEAAVQQVRGVDKVTSTSTEGGAAITMEFSLDTDMEFARLELSERIASVEEQLPVGVRTNVEQYVPDEFQQMNRPLLSYTVSGPYTLEALRQNVDDVIEPELRQVDGVGEVRARGGRARILEIELDENKIRALGLRPEVVRARVQAMEIVSEAGSVLTPDGMQRTLSIRDRTESADEVRSLPVLSNQGRVVRISDVGEVRETYEEPQMYNRIDGQPAVSFQIIREPRSNAVATADRVKARLAAIENLNPAGTRIILDYDQSKDIRKQLTDLRTRALISAVIVFLVLILFLRSLPAAGIVFATVAFAVLITVNIMYFAGFTLNLLTLMGLAMGFGLVVDNAIVVLENTYRKRVAGEQPEDAATHGAGDVLLAVLAATGTTVVVLIPFVYLQGELRIYYLPLALVVGISLLASMAVAFTFIPSLAARVLKTVRGLHTTRDGRPPLYSRIYGGLIRFSLNWPWVTVAIALLALGGSWHLFDKYVNRGVIWGSWGDQKDAIDIYIRQPRGEELSETDELTRYFESRLRQMPEIDRFTSAVYAQQATIHVTFPDSLQYSAVPPAIKEQLVQYSLLFGGTDVRVQGFGPSFYGGGGGSSPNYSIKILGYNYEEVRLIAEDIANRLRRFSRIREVDTNSAGSFFTRDKATEIVVQVDRARVALHDLTTRDVVSYVAAAVRGRNLQNAGNIRLAGDEMQLLVKLNGARDLDVHKLEDLLIPTMTAREGVRLADIATVTERQVLNQVIREDQQYQRIVSYEFRGPNKLGDRVLETVLNATSLPPGYSIEERQVWSWSAEEKEAIWGVTAVAIVLIYMVTASVFESLRQPFCVLLTVPMALIGVFLVFFYANASFTREAYIGVIMMAGIVVNNAILLVDHVNQLRRKHGMELRDALVKGTLERVRPILMTSLTTICGLLPLVLFSPSANANIWNALAYTLIGGLASSTILVLSVTPALYFLLEKRKERKRLEVLAAAQPAPAPA